MAEAGDDPYRSALEVIEYAKLVPNDVFQLSLFVHEGLDPVETGRYVLDRISGESATKSVEDTLLSIKDDLISLASRVNRDDTVLQDLGAAVCERENYCCCVTGERDNLQPTYIVAPSILGDDALRPGGYLRPLLETLLTSKIASQLESFLQSQSREDGLRNMWLMGPPARNAFRNGQIEITRMPSYGGYDFNTEVVLPKWSANMTGHGRDMLNLAYFNPSTPDDDRLPLPKRALLRIHNMLSLPLHFLSIEREIQEGWPPVKREATMLGSTGIFLLRCVFHVIPSWMRLALYKYAMGEKYHYCRPFPSYGLCLKKARPQTMQNETCALRLVEKHTTVPAPRLIDSIMEGDSAYILMTLAQGDRLDQVMYRMTGDERRQLGRDIGKCVSQWRRIGNPSPYAIANTLGGPAYDHRFEETECGPFTSTEEFSDYLTEFLEDRRQEPPLSALYNEAHKVYFTHSDLHQTNICVQAGRLSCIIDWEHAGFKPEYWEYTKSLWQYWARKDQRDIMDYVFEEDYGEELQAEKYLWRTKPVF